MGQRMLTQDEREQIYLLKRAGQTLGEIASEMGLSYECARKWWRRGRDEGFTGLLGRKRGRVAQGSLSQFSAEVQPTSLKYKREHKRWGANRILIELRHDPLLAGAVLQSRSS